MRKQGILAIFAVLLCAVMLAGCGGGPQQSGADGGAPTMTCPRYCPVPPWNTHSGKHNLRAIP